MVKKGFKVLFIVLFMLGLAGCKSKEGEGSRLLVSHGHNTEHPVHNALVYMTEEVNNTSRGKYQFEIFPNGQLGGERDVIELVKAGVLDIAKVSASALEQFNPNFSIFSLPYLFTSTEHYYNVMENSDVVKEIFMSGLDDGIVVIAWYDSGSRSIYTKADKKMSDPSDLSGFKIRTQESTTSTRMIRAMGGSPTPMSGGEVYTSLQQGVIDGAENNETVLLDSGHGEVTAAYTYTQHQYSPDIVIISSATWNTLSKREQDELLRISAESTEYHKGLWSELVRKNIEGGHRLGVNFYTIDKTPFIEAVGPLHEEFKGESENNRRYFEEIQKMDR